jgi:lysozyme family protein
MNWEPAAAGYYNLWRKAEFSSEKTHSAAVDIAQKVLQVRSNYDAVELQTGVPWWFTGIIHHLESGGKFSTHLHNGDPLTARTTHVPAGRPLTNPPFTWIESAIDALNMKGLLQETDWSYPKALWNFERYNGFGYVAHEVNSPYVWSFTNLYSRGKYVADHVWSASAVSEQCGAAAILLVLIELKKIPGKEKELPQMKTFTLADALPIIEKLAPIGAGILGGPLRTFAMVALAQVLSTDSSESAVTGKLLSLPLQELNSMLDAWELSLQPLVAQTVRDAAGPTPLSDSTATPTISPVVSAIDSLFGLTGWKTIIGIVIYVGITAASFFFPAVITGDVVNVVHTIAEGVIGVGLVAKLDRYLALIKRT